MTGLDLLAASLAAIAAALGLVTLRWNTRRVRRWRRALESVVRQLIRRVRPPAPVNFDLHPITRVRVVDGDTIDDRKTRIRYRVVNIDAPETQDRAKCFRERKQGQIAKNMATGIFRRARTVIAKPVGRLDVHGRVVAAIEVDGEDFGELMVKRGVARRWTGVREKWCGPQGGLAALARTRSHQWSCKTCKNWR